MSISGEVGQREVLYPSTVTYQGGLYYEYLGGSLVYARVSYWGEGPNVIYGMRQGKVGGRLRGRGTGRGRWMGVRRCCRRRRGRGWNTAR